MAKDPVCGMDVDPRTAQHSAHDNGHTYYFCSQACKNAFLRSLSPRGRRKGIFTRFLEWVSRGNKEHYGDKPPSCCKH